MLDSKINQIFLQVERYTIDVGFFAAWVFCILIKITHCHYLVRIFLQNRTTDFDETLHVVWVCPGEGFGTIGTSGYSPI